jgi:hypothetical protein
MSVPGATDALSRPAFSRFPPLYKISLEGSSGSILLFATAAENDRCLRVRDGQGDVANRR